MALYDIELITDNVFEEANDSGVLTVTGTPDTGFPESRLGDRAVSLFWKDTATGAYSFEAFLATASSVDFLAVHRHNFSGIAIDWQYDTLASSSGESYANIISQFTPTDNNQIIKTVSTPVESDAFKLAVASITNPRCGEIWMGRRYSYQVMLDAPPPETELPQVVRVKTLGGPNRFVKRGMAPRTRSYGLRLTDTQRTQFLTQMVDLDEYSKGFYIRDHQGEYFPCFLTQIPVITPINDTLFNVSFAIEEDL